MVVKTTGRGGRAQVLLSQEERPVVAEILNPADPDCRTVEFSPLWLRNHRYWKYSVAHSANNALDADLAAEAEETTITERPYRQSSMKNNTTGRLQRV